MSDLGTFDFDSDGFIDMSQFPDDGTDLAGSDLADLRELLLSDTVDEPTPEDWDGMVGEIVGEYDAEGGPFSLDDDSPGAGLTTADPLDDGLTTADVPDVDADDGSGVIPDDGDEDGLALGDDDSNGVFDDSFDLDPSVGLDPSGAGFDDSGLDDHFDAPVEDTGTSPSAGSDFEDYF